MSTQTQSLSFRRIVAADRAGAACVVTIGAPGTINCLQATLAGAGAAQITAAEAAYLIAHLIEHGAAAGGEMQRPFVPVLLEDGDTGRSVGAVVRGRAFTASTALPGAMSGHWVVTLITPTSAQALGEADADLVPWGAFASQVFGGAPPGAFRA